MILKTNNDLVLHQSFNNKIQLLIKDILDKIIAGTILLLVLPLFIIIAIFIKLNSKGPFLFKQERCGLNEKRFICYKFRTMVVNAEKIKIELLTSNEMRGPVFKIKKDPRVTKIGSILRRTSLDELPQLFNVLKGDMSLVGPRPPIPEEMVKYESWQRRRLSMKPGLTCTWQVSGRNNINFEEWMKLDLEYIDNWNLLLDIKLLLKTIPVVLFGKGAF